VRNCPFTNRANTQFMGEARVAAVAGDILASANNYATGGIAALSDWTLHEQMEDPDGIGEAHDICHVAIDWATSVLSPKEPW
jgi:hypothetical protein